VPSNLTPPNREEIRVQVRRAHEEDVGTGDLTAGLIPVDAVAEATVISRESAVQCGRAWFEESFWLLDPSIAIDWETDDGMRVAPDQVLCHLRGPARALLTGERTALNFLQTLSGTATLARAYADALAGTATRVLDTRKTIPGLRVAQKYAVRCGGGHNHRIGLYDAILIKENHIAAAGSITKAVEAARMGAPASVKIEVEVENETQLQEALTAGVKWVLLDNMDLADLRQAVRLNAGRAQLEASGNVSLDNIRAIAETGVDFISVGSLTKHVRAVDLSMRFRASLSQ
jgi:nicotinate-nucleotide pyrophosphorylase (carboxylating)